jgi:hypothetical protein
MIVIQHWREDELYEEIHIHRDMIRFNQDGTVSILFPPGYIEIVASDELRFSPCQLKAIAQR